MFGRNPGTLDPASGWDVKIEDSRSLSQRLHVSYLRNWLADGRGTHEIG